MENSRRLLMGSSIITILFAIITLLDIGSAIFVGDAFVGFGDVEQIVKTITGSFVLLVSFIFLIPEFYVGFKGIKVARDPDSSRAHIFWATLIFIVTLLNIVSAVIGLADPEAFVDNGIAIVDNAFRATVYFTYIKSAKDVRV